MILFSSRISIKHWDIIWKKIRWFLKGAVIKYVKKFKQLTGKNFQTGNVVAFFNLSLLEVGSLDLTSSCVFNGAS